MKYIYTFIVLVFLASCDSGLGITEANFNLTNVRDFSRNSYSGDLNPIVDEKVKEILIKAGRAEELMEYEMEGEWYFYSWQGKEGLDAFTLFHTTECDWWTHYFVFDGDEFKSEKLVASFSGCGDYEGGHSSIIQDSVITTSYYGLGAYDLYADQSVETCIVKSDGTMECEEPIEIVAGTSLWNGLALRETPDRKGKFITQVNIGETFTAEEGQDDPESEYIKIELADGTSGHILKDLVAVGAVPLAITTEATIYRRPDELTRTTDTFYPMDVVGLVELGPELRFYKVKGKPEGEKWFKTGWIQIEDGTRSPVEIAVAALYKKAKEEKDPVKRHEMLEAIRSNSDFESSDLMDWVNYDLQ